MAEIRDAATTDVPTILALHAMVVGNLGLHPSTPASSRKVGFAVEGRRPRHYRRRSGELWDSIVMGLVLDHTSPGSAHPDHGPEPVVGPMTL